VRTLTGADGEIDGGANVPSEREYELFPTALAGLETVVLDACSTDAEWPEQITAAIYAGVDFAIANPVIARILMIEVASKSGGTSHYERVVGRFAGFIRVKAPLQTRLPVSTDEALVAGIVGLVGDHIRIGRADRLAELRPELVLLTLLPYLGFSEAQRWANLAAHRSGDDLT
jgi:hypothetical protein